MSTRPGSSASNCSTASSPVTASPTTSKPGRRRHHHPRGAAERGLVVDDQHGHGGHRRHGRRVASVARTGQPGCGHPAPRGGASTRSAVTSGREVQQHRLHPAVHVGLLRHAELGEQRVDVLLDRPLRQAERGARSRRCCGPSAISREHLALAGRQEVERRLRARARGHAAPPRRAGRSPSRRRRPPRSRAAARRRRRRAPSAGRRGRRSRARAARARRRARRTGSAPRRRRPDASRGCRLAARTPSSVPVGGMRMSVSTTSGGSASTLASSASKSS